MQNLLLLNALICIAVLLFSSEISARPIPNNNNNGAAAASSSSSSATIDPHHQSQQKQFQEQREQRLALMATMLMAAEEGGDGATNKNETTNPLTTPQRRQKHHDYLLQWFRECGGDMESMMIRKSRFRQLVHFAADVMHLYAPRASVEDAISHIEVLIPYDQYRVAMTQTLYPSINFDPE